MIDRKRLAAEAEKERENCAQFLRDICRIPATSNQEGPVVERVKKEMQKVGFDEIRIDKYGNILGRIGNGKRHIAFDSHLDTVGVGDPREWDKVGHDPFEGKRAKMDMRKYSDALPADATSKGPRDVIWARGSSDQRGGIAAMVYAGKLIKKLGLAADCTVWMVGSICEEDSDGIAWLYLLREKVFKPEVVVISEPTNLNIYRGHRGRMEIKVKITGVSCHASAPERGVNPVYKAVPFIQEIEKLNKRLTGDKFLGKGTIAVTKIQEDTPSQCAVPSSVEIHLDRRLEVTASKESAVAEVKACLKRAGIKDGKVWVPVYKQPSWRGTVYPMENYYPGWCLDADHSLVKISEATHVAAFGKKGKVSRWVFSTNATASTGLCGVPSIGFGPGAEDNAHMAIEHMPVDHLVAAMKFYAAFPSIYTEHGGLKANERKYVPKRK
jgi:putative selenium metabolism hydrolase